MRDNIAKHVCSLIAKVMDVPPANVRPETALSLADLGWKGFLMITLEIEHEFLVPMPIEVPISTCFPLNVMGSLMIATMRAAICATSSRLAGLSRTTTNSSPPRRATVSDWRTWLISFSATTFNNSSPTS